MSAVDPPLLDAAIRLDHLPSDGRNLEVEATPEQRRSIAERLQVERVDALRARLNARPMRGGIHVRGHLSAEVVQLCVVTFVPVSQTIDEPVDRVFLPGRAAEFEGQAGAEVFVDLEGEDLPDYFEGPEVDFTELLLEVLSLAVDPYPRAPGAELPGEATEAESAEDTSPFAKLKQLRDRT